MNTHQARAAIPTPIPHPSSRTDLNNSSRSELLSASRRVRMSTGPSSLRSRISSSLPTETEEPARNSHARENRRLKSQSIGQSSLSNGLPLISSKSITGAQMEHLSASQFNSLCINVPPARYTQSPTKSKYPADYSYSSEYSHGDYNHSTAPNSVDSYHYSHFHTADKPKDDAIETRLHNMTVSGGRGRTEPKIAHPELLELAQKTDSFIDLSLHVFSPLKNNSTGLTNLGNTCYMNSILQCLMATKPFVAIFLSSRISLSGTLTKAFSQFVDQFTSKAFGTTSPASLKRVLQQRARQFIGNEQHDSQEFLRTLINELHNDLNKIAKIPKFTFKDAEFDGLKPNIKAEISWNRSKRYEDSVIQDVFSGQLESMVKCCNQRCSHISSTYERFWDLSIPVSPSGQQIFSSVEDCLKEYFKEELLEMTYKCEKCSSQATKKLAISRFPAILVLHFKRFKSDPGSFQPTRKLSHPISFPSKGLSLRDFQSTVSETKKTTYDLVAVSNHFGSLHGGHYTAATRNWIDSNWTDRNDSQVSPLSSINSHDTKAAYILFYERIYAGGG